MEQSNMDTVPSEGEFATERRWIKATEMEADGSLGEARLYQQNGNSLSELGWDNFAWFEDDFSPVID
uniref:Uncharacterized protein n=1 Tax=Solanum lycopersicum TaxID=4081 RepID=A0A3Q7FG98_SOLLC